MPNWCNNFVQINHSDPARITALAEAIDKGKFCNFVIPCPQELIDTVAGYPGKDLQAAHEAQEKANLDKYGYKNWYDFCVDRWGTKWDIDAHSNEIGYDGTHLSLSFDSAWSPPTGVYAALVEQGYQVDAMYYEPGMGFCGRWRDGVDDYVEITGMTADEVANTIDADIDEQFCISENMAMWEEETEQQDEEEERLNSLPPHTD